MLILNATPACLITSKMFLLQSFDISLFWTPRTHCLFCRLWLVRRFRENSPPPRSCSNTAPLSLQGEPWEDDECPESPWRFLATAITGSEINTWPRNPREDSLGDVGAMSPPMQRSESIYNLLRWTQANMSQETADWESFDERLLDSSIPFRTGSADVLTVQAEVFVAFRKSWVRLPKLFIAPTPYRPKTLTWWVADLQKLTLVIHLVRT